MAERYASKAQQPQPCDEPQTLHGPYDVCSTCGWYKMSHLTRTIVRAGDTESHD